MFVQSSKSLYRAAALSKEIETLELELNALLGDGKLAGIIQGKKPGPSGPGSRSSGSNVRPPKQGRGRRRVAKDEVQAGLDPSMKEKAASPVVGHSARTAGLSEAVREVLLGSANPLNVAGIYQALVARKFTFAFPNPKKGLSMRLYAMKGVEALGGGTFASART